MSCASFDIVRGGGFGGKMHVQNGGVAVLMGGLLHGKGNVLFSDICCCVVIFRERMKLQNNQTVARGFICNHCGPQINCYITTHR